MLTAFICMLANTSFCLSPSGRDPRQRLGSPPSGHLGGWEAGAVQGPLPDGAGHT